MKFLYIIFICILWLSACSLEREKSGNETDTNSTTNVQNQAISTQLSSNNE